MSIEAEILKSSKVVAIVGLSSNPDRPSNLVGRYLKANGYRVIPVNPKETEVLGEKAYPDLASVPEPVDVVDVFRPAEEVPAIAREAIRIGAKVLWMQESIINELAAVLAEAAGLNAVMDRCMRQEHMKMVGVG